MRRTFLLLVLVLPAFLSGGASAHHSITAFYDRSVTTEVEGIVTSVFWRNPHVGLTILVENEQGEPEEWELEGGTMNDLVRWGFTEESIQIGDRIIATGAASRRGEPGAAAPGPARRARARRTASSGSRRRHG